MLNVLHQNRLAGVALDVFSQEPLGENAILKQLVSHERVIATPHLILFCRNPDQPGMIGRVGTILGKANVNIRHMDVGPSVRAPHARDPKRSSDTALMIISVDDPIPG